MDRVGIIAWDGKTEVRLRSERSTATGNVLRTLPFNTHLQVIKRYAGGWFFAATPWGEMGFVASDYIRTDLPEPTARLHRVEKGLHGTAIAIAETYYGDEADQWGEDLRFYVAVLAHANHLAVPSTRSGWKEARFYFDKKIWIPGRAYTRGLRGVVNSGSISYEFEKSLTASLRRIEQLLDDGRQAVMLSRKYLGEAIGKRVKQALLDTLVSLAEAVVGGIAIMAVTTAVGAGIGALMGGVTAGAGAAAGFEIGLIILEWLGLAMLMGWVAESLKRLGMAFWSFLGTVWNAHGNQSSIERAAREFALAIADLLGTALEAVLMMAASRGVSATVNTLRGTAFGRSLGEGKLGQWLDARVDNFRDGRGGRPREVLARFFRRVELVDANGSPVGEFDGIDLSGQKFIEYKAARSISKLNPRTGKPQQTPADWAEKQLFAKTLKRIQVLLDPTTRTRAQSSGSPNVPSIRDLRSIRRFQFHIDGDTPVLRSAVSSALMRLRQRFPGWSFEARYGVNILLPPLPDELLLNHVGHDRRAESR